MSTLSLNRDERELVTWATRRGWQVLRRNGNGHLVLRWRNGAQRPVPREFDGRELMRATRAKLEKLEQQALPVATHQFRPTNCFRKAAVS